MSRIAAAWLGLGLFLGTGAVSAQTFSLPHELWEQPRSAVVLLAQPELRQGVQAFLDRPGSQLAIHYGSGEEAQLQAEELRAWLIALSIDAGRIVLRRDLRAGEPLAVEVVPPATAENAEDHVERGEQQ